MAQFAKPQGLFYHQRVVYTQFKKCHGLKFQSVLVPDEFIACLFSPVPAKTHDARLLQESGLLDQLEEIMPHDGDLTIYTLYGNFTYAQSMYLIGGFRNADVGTDDALYNQIMLSVRITVEALVQLLKNGNFLISGRA